MRNILGIKGFEIESRQDGSDQTNQSIDEIIHGVPSQTLYLVRSADILYLTLADRALMRLNEPYIPLSRLGSLVIISNLFSY